jgi:GTP diphosphokinase / guanosine-3',5'-bis(diphosphate) 3'-diphosphatase
MATRAVANSIALTIKLADNAESMDLSRIQNPSEKNFSLLEEYKLVREFLLSNTKEN